MSDREKIEAGAWDVVAGKLITTTEPGLCLAFVRQVLEHALGWPSHRLYELAVTSWVIPGWDQDQGHVSRDAERDLRDLGMTLTGDRVRGGDILFNWRAAWSTRYDAYVGHVGIALGDDLVLEVVLPAYRPQALVKGGGLCLGPRSWAPTTVIRFDSSKIPMMRSGGR